jgi:hypothetical protein
MLMNVGATRSLDTGGLHMRVPPNNGFQRDTPQAARA